MSSVGDQIRMDRLLDAIKGKDISNLIIVSGTCEDCKHSNGRYIRREGQIDQNAYCRCEKYHDEFRRLNFYCADFERRENSNDKSNIQE